MWNIRTASPVLCLIRPSVCQSHCVMLGYFLSSVAATSGRVTPIGKRRNKLIGKKPTKNASDRQASTAHFVGAQIELPEDQKPAPFHSFIWAGRYDVTAACALGVAIVAAVPAARPSHVQPGPEITCTATRHSTPRGWTSPSLLLSTPSLLLLSLSKLQNARPAGSRGHAI